MENTLENKRMVFALYWGQEVIKVDMPEWIGKPNREVYALTMDSDSFKNFQLQLKPISSISDEDALHLSKMAQKIDNDTYLFAFNSEESAIKYVKNNIYLFYSRDRDSVDYLRSKGYALPAFGLSEEELVNRGWFKLV